MMLQITELRIKVSTNHIRLFLGELLPTFRSSLIVLLAAERQIE
jgi:hypothetical protein